MATITEDFVSFETAKLLKDKGFDIGVRYYYQKIDDDITYHIGDFRNWNVYDMWYSMPTLQMAMKWLREAHNLFIEIKYATSLFSQPHTTMYFQICYMSLDYNISGKNMLPDNYIREYYTSYEGACEAAIKYCLENLI